MKFGLKEGSGVVAGVVVGKFIFKSNNILVITAMGVAGGIIAHYMFNKNEKKDSLDYISQVEEEMQDEEEESSFYGTNREMEFNKNIGYHTPNGQMTEQEPRDYMDINF